MNGSSSVSFAPTMEQQKKKNKLRWKGLLKERSENRLRLKSLNQKIRDLQAEMKETEALLIQIDDDIDRLEEETGECCDDHDSDDCDYSQSEDLPEPSQQQQQLQQRHHRSLLLSATQADEHLPEPATQSPAPAIAAVAPMGSSSVASARGTGTGAGVGQLDLVLAAAEKLNKHSKNKTNKNKPTLKNASDAFSDTDTASVTAGNRENSSRNGHTTAVVKQAPTVAPPPMGGTAAAKQGTMDAFFQPRRPTATEAATAVSAAPPPPVYPPVYAMQQQLHNEQQQQQPTVIDLSAGHDYNNYHPTLAPAPSPPHQLAVVQQQQHLVDPNAHFRDDRNFPAWSRDVHNLLHSTFQLTAFRDHQKEIINATLSGQDVFVVMRTGGGKSLTYQLPALLEGRFRPGKKVTFVVSPLLSLIQDQEDQMNQFAPGSAISFSSNLQGGITEHARRWALVRDPSQGVCLVFITPEKISQSKKLQTELEKLAEQGRLGRFVIDECHCASQWGHDFRPDYTKLGVLKRHFPQVPCIAVTATASEKVRDDVCDILCLGNNYRFFRSSANRPNLIYSVRSKREGKEVVADMVSFIKEHHARDAGIVYTFSKKDADTLADNMCTYGVVARAYHSDVTPKNKELIHNSWMRNETQVVVATIAFGLGINKPDVRFVLHHSISKTLDAYYQESGRAGRDGKDAHCVLYYNPKDVPRMLKMVHGTKGESLLWPMVRYAQASSHNSVCRAILMAHLGEPIVEDMEPLIRSHDGTYTERRDVGRHCQTVARLLDFRVRQGEKLTMSMLLKEWRSKADDGPQWLKDFPPKTVPATADSLTAEECERIIISLLVESVFEPQIIWTAYDSIVYLAIGARGPHLLQSNNPSIFIRFPKRDDKRKSSQDVQKKIRKTVTEEGGWLTAKPKASKKRSKPSASSKKKVAKKKAKKATGAASRSRSKEPAKKAAAAAASVIDLYSDDDEDPPAKKSSTGSGAQEDGLWDDDSSDEENEFDG